MKIAACADLHLGAGADYGAAPGDRLREQGAIWRGICADAAVLGASLFLFCGDAFHRRRPSPAELLEFQSGLDELRRGGVPVVMVAGNHDVAAADEPSALELFRGQGVRVSRRPEVFDLDLGFLVATLPWTPPLRAMAGAEDPEEARKAVADDLLEVARGLRGAHPDQPMVLVAHWSVSTARTPSGELADLFREPVLPRDELAAAGFDLVVLGHIHNPVVLHEHPAMFYCGSPVVVNYGEADAAHGWWEIEWPPLGRRYHVRGDRRFLTFDYDVRDGDAEAVLFGSELPDDPAGAVVRVRVRARGDQAIDVDAVRRRFYAAGAVRVWHVAVDTDAAPRRAALDGVDEQTNPLVALSAYLEAEQVEAEVRTGAVALAERFLREGDDG